MIFRRFVRFLDLFYHSQSLAVSPTPQIQNPINTFITSSTVMVKLDRARQASLKVWVQQQYIDTGFKDGKPLGKEMFKKQLLSRLPNEFKVEVDKAREFVNTIYRFPIHLFCAHCAHCADRI